METSPDLRVQHVPQVLLLSPGASFDSLTFGEKVYAHHMARYGESVHSQWPQLTGIVHLGLGLESYLVRYLQNRFTYSISLWSFIAAAVVIGVNCK